MKIEEQVLTIEQAKHLQELGLDMSDAALCWYRCIRDRYGNNVEGKWSVRMNPIMIGLLEQYEEITTYTLQEVLNKLPSGMTWDTWQWQITGSGDEMEYNDGDGYSPCREVYGNILEKAYNMLCWVMEHKYLSNFSHYENISSPYVMCGGNKFSNCIHYDGNENLLGKTDDYVEPYVPQDGDFVTYIYPNGNKYVAIFYCTDNNLIDNYYADYTIESYSYKPNSVNFNDGFDSGFSVRRLATKEEKLLLISKLHEVGKVWNAEKKCIENVWTPKNGDFVYISFKYDDLSRASFIYVQKGDKGDYTKNYFYFCPNSSMIIIKKSHFFSNTIVENVRPATDSEKQQLLDVMHKKGKDWDADKKEIIEYKWKPNIHDKYYYVNSSLIVDSETWTDSLVDIQRYNIGNCFRIFENAKLMVDKLKNVFIH